MLYLTSESKDKLKFYIFVIQVFVLFKTHEAAKAFLSRDLVMLDKRADAILYSDIEKLIGKRPIVQCSEENIGQLINGNLIYL